MCVCVCVWDERASNLAHFLTVCSQRSGSGLCAHAYVPVNWCVPAHACEDQGG